MQPEFEFLVEFEPAMEAYSLLRCIAVRLWFVAAERRNENGRYDGYAFDLGPVLGCGMEEYQLQAHFEFVPLCTPGSAATRINVI